MDCMIMFHMCFEFTKGIACDADYFLTSSLQVEPCVDVLPSHQLCSACCFRFTERGEMMVTTDAHTTNKLNQCVLFPSRIVHATLSYSWPLHGPFLVSFFKIGMVLQKCPLPFKYRCTHTTHKVHMLVIK